MIIPKLTTILPISIKAVSVENPDGSYTVLINAARSRYDQRCGMIHELRHILRNDFRKDKDVGCIEREVRK